MTGTQLACVMVQRFDCERVRQAMSRADEYGRRAIVIWATRPHGSVARAVWEQRVMYYLKRAERKV
jgi:hypothetical protein